MSQVKTRFNRMINIPDSLGEFLKVEGGNMSPEELTSRLWDRLYRTGSVRHLDGTRARRRRARDRQRARRRELLGS